MSNKNVQLKKIDGQPGHALMRVTGEFNESQSPFYISIKSPQNGFFLSPGKKWSETSYKFELGNITIDNGLETVLNPDIVDPLLEAEDAAAFEATLIDSQDNEFGITLFFKKKSSFLLSTAYADKVVVTENTSIDGSAKIETPVIAEKVQEPEQQPDSANTTVNDNNLNATDTNINQAVSSANTATIGSANTGKKKSRLILWLLLALLVLLIIGALAFWKLGNPFGGPATGTAASTADSTATADAANTVATAEPGVCNLNGDSSDLELVQQCLAADPSSQEILALIQEGKSKNRCDFVRRIYANKSQSGDLLILENYVKEYDPKYFVKSECFTEPNGATAQYWYQTILDYDPNNQDAKQRLEELEND